MAALHCAGNTRIKRVINSAIHKCDELRLKRCLEKFAYARDPGTVCRV